MKIYWIFQSIFCAVPLVQLILESGSITVLPLFGVAFLCRLKSLLGGNFPLESRLMESFWLQIPSRNATEEQNCERKIKMKTKGRISVSWHSAKRICTTFPFIPGICSSTIRSSSSKDFFAITATGRVHASLCVTLHSLFTICAWKKGDFSRSIYTQWSNRSLFLGE